MRLLPLVLLFAMTAQAQQLPKSVRVGPLTYKVVVSPEKEMFDSEGHKLYGQTLYAELTIRIRENIAHDKMCETLLHEVLHAAAFNESDSNEEAFVNGLAPWLLGVLRDNPDLLKFLTK